VLQHSPSRERKLAEVKDQVKERVRTLQAAELARKEGEARLAQLRSGASKDELNAPKITLSRMQSQEGLSPDLVNTILKAPEAPLPAWLGGRTSTEPDAAYAVVRLLKVKGPDLPASEAQQAHEQYGQAWADAERQAYETALKARFKVEVTHAAEAGASQATEATAPAD
jgi:peptidyl-prolyl cis-trans isomerase D